MSEFTTADCSDCGNTVSAAPGEHAVCYGIGEEPHPKNVVIRPCGLCGTPITTAEICDECAEKHDGDAVTPTWGTHRYSE